MVIDMGGTSFEVSLITDSTITMSRETEIEQLTDPLIERHGREDPVGAGWRRGWSRSHRWT